MGSSLSKQIIRTKITRNPGDLLNTQGLPAVHTETFTSHIAPITRIPICRCWKSAKFPLCDNSHQKLEKLGVECGIKTCINLYNIRSCHVRDKKTSLIYLFNL